MAVEQAGYTFLSFVRQGIAAAISDVSPPSNGVAVSLKVNESDPSINLRLYGPGDIVGIDSRIVIRTEPRHLTTDFEPNYLPAIDFDPPDFPWAFTPVGKGDQVPWLSRPQLPPWICLVVVPQEKDRAEIVKPEPNRPLPVLRCRWAELPDLGECWAWAHSQIAGLAANENVRAALTGPPELTLSRLIAPRKLDPNRRYYACVVPTFEAGRQAGLGEPVSQDLVPAWPLPGQNEDPDSWITLPVYYHWEFSTGVAADFESLVRLLKPQPLAEDVGLRELDVGAPGLGLPPAAANAVGLEGALRTPQTRRTVWPDEEGKRFQDDLGALLNRLEASLDETVPSQTAEPVVGPPIYGRWHAAKRTLDPDSSGWLPELNLDPRYRAAAGFGTLVVQDQQEQLMASAWEQLGEIQRANQILRQAQLARAVGLAIHEKRLALMQPDVLVQISGPAHARVAWAAEQQTGTGMETRTLRYRIRESVLPEAVVRGSFRRVARPRGPIFRRMRPAGDRRVHPFVGRLAAGAVTPAVARDFPDGMVSLDAVSDSVRGASPKGPARSDIRFRDLTPVAISLATGRASVPSRKAPSKGRPGRGSTTRPRTEEITRDRFKVAALAHQAHVMQALAIGAPQPKPALPLKPIRPKLLEALDPRITLRERISLRIQTGTGKTWEREDPLDPIMVHPQFPHSMIEPLQEISQELVLPGLERVPVNTISLVQPNPRFIEAYMVGLNHEMSRELLWREFPTDQRGTYFRRFWDIGDNPFPPPDEGLDIPDLREWSRDLGEHMTEAGAERLTVLLIRGELLRRYPGTTIYAVRAEWSGERRRLGQEEIYPLFRGRLDPDVTFVGFRLDVEEAEGVESPPGDPGWYFVLQQQPTEPRFGFDLSRVGETVIKSWNELAWPDISTSQPPAAPYVIVADSPSTAPNNATWGSSSADMARIALQQPVRIAIHAASMLKGLRE